MQFEASNRTAALAGLSTGLGTFLIFDFWEPREKAGAMFLNHFVEYFLLVLFCLLPCYFFVMGGATTWAKIKFQTFSRFYENAFAKANMLRWCSFGVAWVASYILIGESWYLVTGK